MCWCFRRCWANFSHQWRHRRHRTEGSSKVSSGAEHSLWTERSYVRQTYTCTDLPDLVQFSVFNIRLTHLSLLFSLESPPSVGEIAAGKASRSLAQHIPGPGGIEGMKGAASGIVGDLARARIALDERGQKLGELDERTAAMMASADSFSKHAHDVSLKHGHTYMGKVLQEMKTTWLCWLKYTVYREIELNQVYFSQVII